MAFLRRKARGKNNVFGQWQSQGDENNGEESGLAVMLSGGAGRLLDAEMWFTATNKYRASLSLAKLSFEFARESLFIVSLNDIG